MRAERTLAPKQYCGHSVTRAQTDATTYFALLFTLLRSADATPLRMLTSFSIGAFERAHCAGTLPRFNGSGTVHAPAALAFLASFS